MKQRKGKPNFKDIKKKTYFGQVSGARGMKLFLKIRNWEFEKLCVEQFIFLHFGCIGLSFNKYRQILWTNSCVPY